MANILIGICIGMIIATTIILLYLRIYKIDVISIDDAGFLTRLANHRRKIKYYKTNRIDQIIDKFADVEGCP